IWQQRKPCEKEKSRRSLSGLSNQPGGPRGPNFNSAAFLEHWRYERKNFSVVHQACVWALAASRVSFRRFRILATRFKCRTSYLAKGDQPWHKELLRPTKYRRFLTLTMRWNHISMNKPCTCTMTSTMRPT